MKNNRNNSFVIGVNIFVITIFSIFSTPVNAQNNVLATGYYNEGYVYRHRLNPALVNSRGYFTLPFFSVSAGVNSTLAPKDMIYTEKVVNGKYQTFFSQGIDTQMGLDKIKEKTRIDAGADATLLSMGFYGKTDKVYTTIEAELRAGLQTALPKGVFHLLKSRLDNNISLDLSGLGINMDVMAQVSFGQSIKMSDNVRFGYKLKGLSSFANFDANLKTMKMGMTLSQEEGIEINTEMNGEVHAQSIMLSTDGVEIPFKDKIELGEFVIDKDFYKNYGFAVDLGITWDVTDYLNLSASVRDMGMIFQKSALSYKMYEKIELKIDNIEDLGEGLMGSAESSMAVGKRVKALQCTVNAGLQLSVPTHKQLSFGALYTQRFHNTFGAWEMRASANYDLGNFLSLSASYAYGTFGGQLGGMATLHIPGLNIFVGADSIPTKYLKNGIPFNTGNITVHAGLAFHIGKKKVVVK